MARSSDGRHLKNYNNSQAGRSEGGKGAGVVSELFYQQNRQQPMKESRSCHTCQRQSYNLLSATCGHKICFHCVKSNKYSHKCAACASNQPRARPFLSPSRNADQKERTTKCRDSEAKLNSDHSPHTLPKSRPSLHRSSLATPQDNDEAHSNPPSIACKEHQEPLSMYCRSAKELICSVCLCNRAKYGDVVPLRSAEEQLRRENKLNREECRLILGNVENAHRVVNRNEELFRSSLDSSLRALAGHFAELHREAEALEKQAREELAAFFEGKLQECREIETDLQYLGQILREFRESNKDGCSFSELLYLFSSFKVIKGTIRSLNLDYLPYSREPQLVELGRSAKELLRGSVRLRLELPLKAGERRARSSSNKSASRSRHEEWEEVRRGGFTGAGKERGSVSKKHQMSLCNNVHGISVGEEERNLYKQLLKTKFKL